MPHATANRLGRFGGGAAMKWLLFLALAASATVAPAKPFSFVAYGDTGYKLPRDAARVEKLVNAINRVDPAFTIHVGDFKGYSSCSDAAYAMHKAVLARHAQPLVLTPGDNDWADCDAETAGKFDPLERLRALRRMFFAGAESLGAKPMRLERQNAAFPENARWKAESVVFATVHVIGPHNGLIMDKARAAEAIDRSAAGERWIKQAFATARESNAPAVVLAFQVDPWITGAPIYEGGPLEWLRRVIGEEAAKFAGQVLVVHGDSHRLIVDTPYRRTDIDAGTTRGMNVTRLQVPGWPDHRAVRVEVDPSRPDMFGFRLVMSPEEAAGAKP
jgi:hypothetical protein